MPRTQFGTFIKNIRKSRGIKQKQLALAIGKSIQYVSDLEIGIRPPPTRNTALLAEIANYYNIPLATLFDKIGINIDLSQEKNRKFMKIMRSRSKAAFLVNGLDSIREDLHEIESLSTDLVKIRRLAQKAQLSIKELETNIMHAT